MAKKAYIIAGHNGKGTGASSKWLDEGSETIVLRDLIGLNLTRLGFLDYVLDDGTSGIADNTKLSSVVSFMRKNAKTGDLSLDIHFNAAASTQANGCEVLIPMKPTNEEIKFASKLHDLVCDTLDIRSRGVKLEDSGQHGSLAMLSSFPVCVNVLLEVCFCTNEQDCKRYFSNREKLAEAIAKLIIDFLK